MIKSTLQMGLNRTGIDTSPIDKKVLIEGAVESTPSMAGDETTMNEARAEYLSEDVPIGSLPPPTSLKGAAGAVVGAAKGTDLPVFIDKIGERLAFERTGARLYGALLGKFDVSEPLPSGPTRAELEKIHDEELAHFEMLYEAMLSLGADPTAITPSADVAAVSSLGILQVIGDPRMNLKQSLEAILVAELVDNDCWKVLGKLAEAIGNDDLAKRFDEALAQEVEHLASVRTWVGQATLAEATGAAPSAPTEGEPSEALH